MSRRIAREAAFKALFQLDFNFEEAQREACENLAIETMFEDNPRLTKRYLPYIEDAVKGTRAHLSEIDELIASHLKEGWQLPRLMAADRNILRLAVYEMKFADKPISHGIVIDEVVELAKIFGSDESPKFVNGLLGAFSRDGQPREKKSKTKSEKQSQT